MGLFDGDDVTSVYVNNIQLMPDPPNFIAKAVIQAILGGYGISEAIVATKPRVGLTLGKRVRNYATNYFNYSLPAFSYSSLNFLNINKPITNTAALNQLKTALSSGSTATIISASYGPADDLEFITRYKLGQLGWYPEYSPYYNNSASQVAITRVSPATPDKFLLWSNRVIEPSSPATNSFTYDIHLGIGIGYVITPVPFDNLLGREDVRFAYDKNLLGQVPYIVKVAYTLASSPNHTRYWFYYPNTNQYPEVNKAIGSTGIFMPIIPIRENFAFLPDTETLGQQSRKLLTKIGIDFETVQDALLNSGSIGEIRDAYVGYSVNLLTEEPVHWSYLFNFFYGFGSAINTTYFNSDGTFKSPQAAAQYYGDGLVSAEFRAYYIFNWSEANFASYLSVDRIFITSEGVPGIANPNISYKRTLTIRPILNFTTATGVVSSTDETSITFECRVGGWVRTVTIFGAVSSNRIGSHNTPPAFLRHGVPMSLMLDMSIVERCPSNIRDAIFYKALTLHINGYRVTHLRWYQTAEFAQFIKFAGIAITVVTLGTGSFVSTLTTAVSTGVKATLILIAETALTIAAISLAGQQIAKWLGPEAAMVFAVIATVYGIADMGAGEIALPGAELALALVPAVQTGMQAELMKAFEELQFEADALLKSNKERLEELERAQSLLSDKGSLDPLFLIRAIPLIFTNESPTEFINRTIHNTNPGTSTLDSIRGYCGNQLTLPKAETV